MNEVSGYYDRNTRRFLAFGGGAGSLAIHRALWGPGVTDSESAADHINDLVADAIAYQHAAAGPAILDLGCGVGGTLFALAKRFPQANLRGLTNSRSQSELAQKFAKQRGLEASCRIRFGDFEKVDLGQKFDVVIAIESMAHARSLPAFLAGALRHLVPGGTLLIVDDFVTAASVEAGSARVLHDFRAGWRLSSLVTVPEIVSAAEIAGLDFVEVRDLSPLIRLDRIRDRVIGVVGPTLRPLVRIPMVGNFVGGAALVRGLRKGQLSYSWLRFTRAS